jgi:hypothetical protein
LLAKVVVEAESEVMFRSLLLTTVHTHRDRVTGDMVILNARLSVLCDANPKPCFVQKDWRVPLANNIFNLGFIACASNNAELSSLNIPLIIS